MSASRVSYFRRSLMGAALASSVVLAPAAAFAQADSSSLSGTVTDPSGAVVPNAKITAHNNATGQDRSVTSGANGSYTIPNLPTGDYTIKVEAQGFNSAVQQGTHLDPNIGARYDAQLKTGESTTSVTVQADANALQTESASVGQLVTTQQVKSIQLNGRNPMYLAQLEPGIMRNSSMAALGFTPDNPFHVDGARSQDTLTTLDGAPQVRTRGSTYSIGVADVDSTSQIQVLSTDYPAEYGRGDSGLIRMVPKSGTDRFHGAAYEYLRNSFFNANQWVRNANTDDPTISQHPSPFRYNQFGWNLNGPIYIPGHFNTGRRKLFFLAGQEYVRYRQNQTSGNNKTPTALMRQGDFSELLNPANIFYGKAVHLSDPRTGTPFPNNVIPAALLSHNGLALLNAYPLPNANGGSYNWLSSAPYPQDQRKDTLVLDYVPADAHHLRFTLLNNEYDYTTPFAGNFNRTPQQWHWPDQVAVLNYTWTINPTLINEAVFSASADHITISYATDTLLDRDQYGIDYPYIYPASGKLVPNKIPTINIADFTTLDGGPYPSHSGGVITRGADSLTKVIGNHTLKFGGSWERSGENDFDQISVSNSTPGSTNNQNGQFGFVDAAVSGVPTSGAAVANAALGQFYTYGEIGPKSYTLFRTNTYEMFAQDSWRATPKLLLEYGLNYAVNPPYYAPWGNQSMFNPGSWNPALAPAVDPITGTITGGDPLNGVVIPGSHFPSSAEGHVPADILNGQYNRLFRGFGRNYSKTVYTDFQPRFGFTYQAMPNTVIRGGIGRFVQRLPITDAVQLGGNAPFQPSTAVTGGSVDNPAGTGNGSLTYPLQLSSQPYNLPSPEAYAWNFTVEQNIPSFGTLTTAYVGRRGIHLQQLENINQLKPGTTQANPNVLAPDALRPFPGFASILSDPDKGASMYNALQVNLKRRLEKGFLFGVAYTWSKSMDFGSDQSTLLPNYYDIKTEWGPSDFDIRNTLVVNYVWDIPFASHSTNGLVKHTLGNWQVSGTTQAQQGQPFSVSTGDDFAGVGPGAGSQRYVFTGTPRAIKKFAGATGSALWFDNTVYHTAPLGTFAPRGTRNALYSPGFQSWNIALQKNIHVIPALENHVVTFRAEAFNFTNHPNLDTPDTNPNSGTFGKVTTKGQTYLSERQLQFSLRYEF